MSLIKRINETYATMDDVKRLTYYCEHSENYYNHEYFGTNFLNTDYALKSMERVKRTYHKENGNQVHHFIFSIQPRRKMDENIKLSYASDILYTIGNYLNHKGFQSIGYIHKKENKYNYGFIIEMIDNVHIHLIVNAVNGYTGLKLTNIQSLLKEMLSLLKQNYHDLHWNMILYI